VRPGRRTLLLLLLPCLIAVALPATAHADAATQALRQGDHLYAEARYREATAFYQRAYDLGEIPIALFDLAECWRQLGDRRRAVSYYKRFRASEHDPKVRAETDKLIAGLEQADADEAAAPGAAPASAQKLPLVAAPDDAQRARARRRPLVWPWAVAGGVAAAVITAVLVGVLVPRAHDDALYSPGSLGLIDRR
jgi:tetratricopeptide (TPR) repeat protein